jgi:hypothetical protein
VSALSIGCAVLALLGQQAPEPAPPAEEPPRADDAAAFTLDVSRPLDWRGLEAACAGLAAAHPSRAELRTLGTTRAGREIPVLELGEGEPGRGRPALLVVNLAERERAGATGAVGAVLRMAEQLLDDAARDAVGARALQQMRVVLIPALDADALPDGDGPRPPDRAVSLDRNFPQGWLPDRLRPRSGRIPLSEPESEALARFLAARTDLAVVLVLGTEATDAAAPFAGAALRERDAAVFARLAASNGGPLAPRTWSRGGSSGGGLSDLAYQSHGVFALASAVGPVAADGHAARVAELAAVVRPLIAALPSLSLGAPTIERLGERLWQLDVRLSNHGAIPTLGALGAERTLLAPGELALAGGRLVAVAFEEATGDARSTALVQGERVEIGRVAGGGALELRVLVEADPGAALALGVTAPRGGDARLELTLPAAE